jgi:hypothetical protein
MVGNVAQVEETHVLLGFNWHSLNLQHVLGLLGPLLGTESDLV